MDYWTDCTSYSKEEISGRTEPRSWMRKAERVRLIVTRLHRIENKWFMLFVPFINKHIPLKSDNLDNAMKEAVIIARKLHKDFSESVNKILCVRKEPTQND